MTKLDKTLFSDLSARGLIKQTTNPKLEELLQSQSVCVYIGFDPTSDSLHVGNLLPLSLLKRFQNAGHQPIALTGGATGMIGDPSGKSVERSLLDVKRLQKNVKGVEKTLRRFLSSEGQNKALFLDNAEWMSKFRYLEFLRDVGKHFTVNHMIAKDSIKSRLEDRDGGISYTEFSYMLIQAYDFYHLNQNYGCVLQAGGSDQWGNITAGCELIRRMRAARGETSDAEVYGLTSPLIIKADGNKYGKSEEGAVWLDPTRTSPYDFYQFFVQTPDEEVLSLLKFFSFLPIEEILALEKEMKKSPESRIPQKALARTLTHWVHGEDETRKAESAAQTFFQKPLSSLKPEEIENAFGDSPSTELSLKNLSSGISLIELLVRTKMVTSKSAARREITAGGIYVNQKRVSDPSFVLEQKNTLHDEYVVLRRGKKAYHLLRFVSSPHRSPKTR